MGGSGDSCSVFSRDAVSPCRPCRELGPDLCLLCSSFLSWGVPLVITVAAVALKKIGYDASDVSVGWCWIDLQAEDRVLWMLLTGKLWEGLAYVALPVLYLLVRKHISRAVGAQRPSLVAGHLPRLGSAGSLTARSCRERRVGAERSGPAEGGAPDPPSAQVRAPRLLPAGSRPPPAGRTRHSAASRWPEVSRIPVGPNGGAPGGPGTGFPNAQHRRPPRHPR